MSAVGISQTAKLKESQQGSAAFNLIKKKHLHHGVSQNINMRSSGTVYQRLDSMIVQEYDTINNVWINLSKDQFAYDENGNNVLYKEYNFNANSKKWTDTSKTISLYNGAGLDSLDISYSLNSENRWVNDLKQKYFYDTKNRDSVTIIYNPTNSNGWDPGTLIKDIYNNTTNKDTLEIQYGYLNNEWETNQKDRYLYDNAGNDTVDVVLDTNNGVWYVSGKTQYFYDANGNDTVELYYNTDTAHKFYLVGKTTYSYNLNYNSSQLMSLFKNGQHINGGFNNMLTQWITSYYTNNHWVYASKYLMYYSPQTICSKYFSTSYNSANNTFTLIVDSMATKGATGYLWDFGDGSTSTQAAPVHQFADSTYYNVCLKITSPANNSCSYCHLIGIDENSNVLRVAGFNLVVANKTALSVNSLIDDGSINIYPNPVSNVISVSASEKYTNLWLELTDIQGRNVLGKYVNTNTPVVISDITSGMYIYKISGNNGILKIGKVVIE